MARQYVNIPSAKFPEVTVHITWTESDGPITLRAHPTVTATGIKKDYAKERKRVARSKEEIRSKQQSLYAAVSNDIERHERKSIVKAAVTDSETVSPMMRAFNALEMSTDPISSEWSPGYAANNMNYFKRNLLSILIQKESTEWTAGQNTLLHSCLLHPPKHLFHIIVKGLVVEMSVRINKSHIRCSTIGSQRYKKVS